MRIDKEPTVTIKCAVFIASLPGWIHRPEERRPSIGWQTPADPEKGEDYGYKEFFDSSR